MIAVIGMVVCGTASLKAQSKKEVIQQLNRKADSLQRVLLIREDNIHQLEVKLARIEGAAEVNNGLIKRTESKADSLAQALMARNATIESQKAEIAKLSEEVTGFKNQEKELSTKNEALMAELKTVKDKTTEVAAVPVKETKTAEAPKEAIKPPASSPVAKTEVEVKSN